ncbi:hypothetical protein DPMN_036825 [Dreissena polymorpha]|uniref:Uncharacterized protein n=1 Tax=Dreissena polymorpha TaxID=45954 RepID=A0A9D4RP69_DREPO|nr:hypothetical protein DPMN_036825 [Dreissena polymorpha]
MVLSAVDGVLWLHITQSYNVSSDSILSGCPLPSGLFGLFEAPVVEESVEGE